MGHNFSDNSLYKIIYRQDGVFLVVNPSKSFDRNTLLSQIIDRTVLKKIVNVDKREIQVAIESARGEEIKIAEKQDEYRIDAAVNVNIAPDRMSATFTLSPPDGGQALNANQILEQLQAKGIKSGIDMAVVYKAGNEPVYNEAVKVAEGTPSQKGEDGRLEILFDTSADRKPRILEDGSVDFREINMFKSVQKGQELARVIPPKAGADGKSVTGIPLIAAKGKPVPTPTGKNVEFVNNTVYASIDGIASYMDGKINVLTILDIPGNVDVSTGNIRFNGNVVIRGNVLTDYVVEATGDVEVHGVVEGATIKAEGDIILKRGIQGLHKGVLVSGHDIIARYIEHCTVTAKNDVKCEAVMHSNVNCGGILELGGRKGLIVGGVIKVGKEIDAKVIGSPMCTVTDIEVGADPTIRDRFKELKEKEATLDKELNNSEKSLEILRKAKMAGTLPPDRIVMFNKLTQLKAALEQQLSEITQELETLEEELSSTHRGRIKVKNIIYSGVKLTIGSASKFVKENTEFAVFFLDGADIRNSSYE